MEWTEARILSVLDACCDANTFPMLDNGYVYLAATRLSLYRSEADWGLVIEVFGFSPREGLPSTCIYSFASRLHDRDSADGYVSREAYERYLASNPHNESRFIHPVDEGEWQDQDDPELVAEGAREVGLRGERVALPAVAAWSDYDVQIEDPAKPAVFELCRVLAALFRERVLATASERRISIRPEMARVLQLDEWNHPDVVDAECRPSGSETFQQLAEVLVTGNAERYRPTLSSNVHWLNWPEGGSL